MDYGVGPKPSQSPIGKIVGADGNVGRTVGYDRPPTRTGGWPGNPGPIPEIVGGRGIAQLTGVAMSPKYDATPGTPVMTWFNKNDHTQGYLTWALSYPSPVQLSYQGLYEWDQNLFLWYDRYNWGYGPGSITQVVNVELYQVQYDPEPPYAEIGPKKVKSAQAKFTVSSSSAPSNSYTAGPVDASNNGAWDYDWDIADEEKTPITDFQAYKMWTTTWSYTSGNIYCTLYFWPQAQRHVVSKPS